MANQWFKFYSFEYLGDPKIFGLSDSERSCWLTLLCLANNASRAGKIPFLTEEQLMLMSGVDFQDERWERTKGILNRFEKLKMVSIKDNHITIINFEKRQKMYLTEGERKARYREGQKRDIDGTVSPQNRVEENRVDIDQDTILKMFETFWELYPNKVAKRKSFQSWIKIELTENLFEKIIASLKAHKESERWGKGIIPHPTTWLNQERWDEVLAKPKEKEKKPYYKGDPMVQKNGRWYVIVKGQWLEYAGKKSEIEYK